MTTKLGSRNQIYYLNASESVNPKNVNVTCQDGTIGHFSLLRLASCSNLMKNIFYDLSQNYLNEDQIFILTNIPGSHLFQVEQLVNGGILTSKSSLEDLHKDEDLLQSFQSLGIDLKNFDLIESLYTRNENGQESFKYGQESFKYELELDPDNLLTEACNEEIESKYGILQDSFDDFQDYDKPSKRKTVRSTRKRKPIIEEYSADEFSDYYPSSDEKPLRKRATRKKIKTEPAISQKKRRREFLSEGVRDESKKYQCSKCIKGYSNKVDFDLHVLKHDMDGEEETKGWVCMQCQTVVQTRKDLKCHILDAHKNDIYPCEFCDKTYKGLRYKQYVRHLETHERRFSMGDYTCIACGYTSKSKSSFEGHKASQGPFHNDQCASCDKIMLTWEEHKTHVEQEHKGVSKYRCGLCPEVFESIGYAKSHRRLKHIFLVKSVCEECGEEVSNISAHMRKYHGTDHIPCPNCDKVFKDKIVFKQHTRKAHMNLICEECGKVMPNKAKYKVHMDSKHTPDHLKPFQCKICPKGFAVLANLRDHINIHTNQRPYTCKFCQFGFNNKANMFNHSKICKLRVKKE